MLYQHSKVQLPHKFMKNLFLQKLIFPVIVGILMFSSVSLSFALEKNPNVWKVPTKDYSKSIDTLQQYEDGTLKGFEGHITNPNKIVFASQDNMINDDVLKADTATEIASYTYPSVICLGFLFIGLIGISGLTLYKHRK